MAEPRPGWIAVRDRPARHPRKPPWRDVLVATGSFAAGVVLWCGHCRRLKAQLDRAGVDFDEIDIERDAAAAAFVGGVNGGNQTVPTVLLPDGSVLTHPTIDQIIAATAA